MAESAAETAQPPPKKAPRLLRGTSKPQVPPGYLGRCRSVDVFERLNRLGEGTYGTVYRARDKESERIVALKKVRIHAEKEGFPISSLREIRLLKKLKHPNVVELFEVACGTQAGAIFLVFEYCEHDLGALLDLMTRPFSQAEVKGLLLQLLRGVAALHAAFVMHRDLKLSNLLLTNKGVLKLADFGLACEFLDPPEPCTAKVVTLWYRAPELLLGARTYTAAIDVWSVGCNFGELMLKRPLLPGKAEEHQLQLVCELLGTPSLRIWPGLEDLPLYGRLRMPANSYNNLRVTFPDATNDACLELLNAMLTFDPGKRATAAGCLRHRYFTEPPAPQDPQWMPTYREHRNEVENPRSCAPPPVMQRARSSNASFGVSSSSVAASTGSGSSTNRSVTLPSRLAHLTVTKKARSALF